MAQVCRGCTRLRRANPDRQAFSEIPALEYRFFLSRTAHRCATRKAAVTLHPIAKRAQQLIGKEIVAGTC